MNLYLIFVLFLIFTGVLSVLYQTALAVPFIMAHLTEIYGIMFLFLPGLMPAEYADSEFEPFSNLKKGLVWGLLSSIIILGAYAFFHHLYFSLACTHDYLPSLGRKCSSFGFRFPYKSVVTFLNLIAVNLIAVALPEEYFYRGFLQPLIFKSKQLQNYSYEKRMFTAIILQAVCFAFGHFFVDWNPVRLSVFFPALLFGYLAFKTESLYAPVLLHGFSNVISDILERGSF